MKLHAPACLTALAAVLLPGSVRAQIPLGTGPVENALLWIQGTMHGNTATTVSVIAVAAVGFGMLTGRLNWRFGGSVILGVFIIFGAGTIVAGIQGTSGFASGSDPVPLFTTDPEPMLNIGPIPLAAADGSPLAAGVWQIGESDTVASASFVSPLGRGLLTMTCEKVTKVISLAVANDLPGKQTFVLQSGGVAARLDTIADNNIADPHQAAAITPQTLVFEGFVHPGSTIEVSQPGGMTLRLPSNSGIRRVFQACQ